MIRVLVDKYGIKEKGKIVLASSKEYAYSWDEIIKLILNENKEIIILKDRHLQRYFYNLQDKFGNRIEIEHVSPHSEWEKSFDFRLPEEISNEEIANLLLLEKIEKLKEVENKRLAVLYMISELTEFSDFKVEESLMECILKGVENKYPQLLNDIIADLVKSLPIGKKEFWQRLKEERNKKVALLDAMKSYIAQSYPSDSWSFKECYKESLTYSGFDFPVHLSSYIDEGFKDKIKDYLNTLKSDKTYSLSSFISGKLREEWEVVCSFLKENPIQDNTIMKTLLKKATGYPDIYEEVQKYMPISLPSYDINERNIEHWIDEYFAFYLYTRFIERPENTERLVKIFEDFILTYYYKSADFFTQHSVLTIRQKIEGYLKKKRKVLFLVIDGLSYIYHKEIRKIFGTRGSFIFSTLPTVTEINKQRILSGLLDLKEPYEEILKRLYKEYHWKESNSDKLDLRSFLQKDYDFYIYWENQFDSYIHRPMTFGKRFEDHTEMLIRISKEIEDFLKGGGVVLLLGDHGYTTLPHNEDNKISVANKEAKIIHNRVLEVKGENKAGILPLENVYWIDNNIAIAQAYHYFYSLPRGATHGGATPEEMIVPFVVIEKEIEKTFKPLELNLFQKEYLRKKKHVTKLVINNQNVYDIQVVSIQFKPSILKILNPMPILIEQGKNILEIELDLRVITTEDCKVFIEYKVDEKAYRDKITIRTTGAMKETFDEWE